MAVYPLPQALYGRMNYPNQSFGMINDDLDENESKNGAREGKLWKTGWLSAVLLLLLLLQIMITLKNLRP